MDSTLETIRFNSEEIKVLIKALESQQEAFLLKYNEYQNVKAHVSTNNSVNDHDKLRQYLHTLEQQLQDKDGVLRQFQVHIVEKLRAIYLRLHHLIHQIHNTELTAWKRNQQLAGNGYNFDAKRLDLIQSWCDDLAEIAWANFNQNKEMKRLIGVIAQYVGDRPLITEALNELNGKFTELLSFLLTNTFVIEKQPPQVMKTNTKFSAKVRLLVGGKLNLYMSPPQVHVSIISEQQADLLMTANTFKGEVSGEILNNTGTMEYDQATQQLSIVFRNLQLKKIRRAEKKGSESVVDEKFALCFSSKFKVNGEIDAYVYCLSLPVAVIVHGNQESHAWAAITWDNAFAEPARTPFIVPDKVNWDLVANALKMKFLSMTGKGLSEDNMNYLAEKVFKVHSTDYNNMQLSWSQFCKENLPERNFTFWDWFYSIMKLTKEHLRQLWVDDTISGFVRKKQAEEILSRCVSGTFLLRFSDSELGGITVAWVAADRSVNMVAPFTAKDFHIRGLADRLDDLMHLQYLYPQIPKKKAFEKYYSPSTELACQWNNGYVLPMLITHLPGFSVTPKVENTNNLQNDLNLLNDAAVNIDDQNICFPEANGVEAFENLMGNTYDGYPINDLGFGNMP